MLRTIRQNGWLYSFAILFNRVVPERLFRFRRFVVYQLNHSPNRRPHDRVITKRCETGEEYDAVGAVTYYQQRSSIEIAVQALYDGELAGGMWATDDSFVESELGVKLLLDRNQAWLFAARVEKPFRRKGVYTRVLDQLRNELQQQGLEHQLVSVNPVNVGSNKVHNSESFYSPGYVTAMRIFKTAFCFTSGDISRDRWIALNSDAKPIEIRMSSKEVPASPPA